MIKVYGDRLSGNCYKVELVCSLLAIEYEWVNMDILAGDTQQASFLSKTTNGKIPLLEFDNAQFLSESNAIINYLAHGSKLLPESPFLLAKVQQWQFFEQYSHEPYIAVARFIKHYLGLPEERRAEYESKHQGGYKALSVMESQLTKTPFLVGDSLTTADISLYAYTHIANQGGFYLSDYPAIQSWLSRVEQCDGYILMKAV